jgi:hypothetical protein
VGEATSRYRVCAIFQEEGRLGLNFGEQDRETTVRRSLFRAREAPV